MIKYLLVCDVCKREVMAAGSLRIDSIVIGDACLDCLRKGIVISGTYANASDENPSGYLLQAHED